MKITVLYVVGAGRSGSTLLEMILGNLQGFFSIGEARYFWEYFEEGGVRCGCADLLTSCPFWLRVLKDLDGSMTRSDRSRVARLAARVDRTRNLPWIETRFAEAGVEDLVKPTRLLYESIARCSGGSIVVDSSKVPSHLYILGRVPDIDLRVLHLVRDGRAVAHAWSRRPKREPGRARGGALMPRRSAAKAALVWALENRYAKRFGTRNGQYTLLRYEDFVQSPLDSMRWALADLDFEEVDLSGFDPDHLRLSPTHSVGGNPVRFTSGEAVAIRGNTKWREDLSPMRRRFIELLIGRALRRYGYDD